MHEMKFDMLGGAAVIEAIAALAELSAPVRVLGLVGAIELVADRETRTNFDPAMKVGPRLAKLCEHHGVIGRALPGDVLAFSPPLIIDEADIDQVLDGTHRALEELQAQLREEQVSAVAGNRPAPRGERVRTERRRPG